MDNMIHIWVIAPSPDCWS